MHFLLFETSPHFCSQFVEKLPDGAVIKVAGILRENLAGEDGDRLAMAGGVTFGIGVEDFAAGDHAGEERGASRGAPLIHLCAVRMASLEIVDPPGRAVPRPSPSVILNSRRGPSEAGTSRNDFTGPAPSEIA